MGITDMQRVVKVPFESILAIRKQSLGFQRLPDSLLNRLKHEGSLCVKTMVYVTFPHRVSPGWAEGLFQELKDWAAPFPEDVLNIRLSELDSDSFRIRHSAASFFLRNFDRTENFLVKAKGRRLSAEASASVARILGEGHRAERDPMENELVQVLKDSGSAEAVAVLKILSSASSGCDLARQAKDALDTCQYPSP